MTTPESPATPLCGPETAATGEKRQPRRRLTWISAGAASAVAAKLDLAAHPAADRVHAYTDPGSEHPDNVRFLADLERWLDATIVRLSSTKYADTWQVWNERRAMRSSGPDDVQVFGYTVEEAHRADRFRKQNPEVDLCTPVHGGQFDACDADGPVWLDELNPDRGNHANEPSFECSLLCAIAEADMVA